MEWLIIKAITFSQSCSIGNSWEKLESIMNEKVFYKITTGDYIIIYNEKKIVKLSHTCI